MMRILVIIRCRRVIIQCIIRCNIINRVMRVMISQARKRTYQRILLNCFNKPKKSSRKAPKSAPPTTIKSSTNSPNTANSSHNSSKTSVSSVSRASWNKQKSNKSDNDNSYVSKANLSLILWFCLMESWESANSKMISLRKCKSNSPRAKKRQLYQNSDNRNFPTQRTRQNKSKPKPSKPSFRWITSMMNWLLWVANKLTPLERKMPNSKENPQYHWLRDYFCPCLTLRNSLKNMKLRVTWTPEKSMAPKPGVNPKFIQTLALQSKNLLY